MRKWFLTPCQTMTSELFFSFMTSLLICMALIPPLRMLADRFHFMDQPGERKVHQHPVRGRRLRQHRLVGAERYQHAIGAPGRIDHPGFRRLG